MADNKVKFGLANCYYAPITAETDNATTYGTPVALPGAVALSLSANGSLDNFYADNNVYYVLSSANNYDGDLEIAAIPRQFLKDIFGDVEDANGALFELSEAPTRYFALMFETDGDVGGHRTVMYKCSATRPELGGNTKTDSVEVKTSTMSIKAIARVDESSIKHAASDTAVVGHTIQASLNTGDTGYDTFFSSVYEPVAP